MADLKMDLLNKLRNDKYFAEIELGRLAQNPNMNYEEKIILMNDELDRIALLNSKMALAEQYFTVPDQQAGMAGGQVPMQGAPAPQQPAGHVHPGQSHGE